MTALLNRLLLSRLRAISCERVELTRLRVPRVVPLRDVASGGRTAIEPKGCFCGARSFCRDQPMLSMPARRRKEPRHARRPHRRKTPPATRTRQTQTRPSVMIPSVSAWPYTPKIPPMAPTTSEPLRSPAKPHHSQGRLLASSAATDAEEQLRVAAGAEEKRVTSYVSMLHDRLFGNP